MSIQKQMKYKEAATDNKNWIKSKLTLKDHSFFSILYRVYSDLGSTYDKFETWLSQFVN